MPLKTLRRASCLTLAIVMTSSTGAPASEPFAFARGSFAPVTETNQAQATTGFAHASPSAGETVFPPAPPTQPFLAAPDRECALCLTGNMMTTGLFDGSFDQEAAPGQDSRPAGTPADKEAESGGSREAVGDKPSQQEAADKETTSTDKPGPASDDFGGGSFDDREPPPRKKADKPDRKGSEQPAGREAAATDDPDFGVNNFEERDEATTREGVDQDKPVVRRETDTDARKETRDDDQVRRTDRVDETTEPGGQDDFKKVERRQRKRQSETDRRDETRERDQRRRADDNSRSDERRQRQTSNDDRNKGREIDPGITAFELRNFGVPPQRQLHSGQMHGPTPTALPGGQVITTQNLARAMVNGERFILVDVLGADRSLPNAWTFRNMSLSGSFQDQYQRQVTAWLAKVTQRNANFPIVVYCSDPMCWMSYNAALRAIAAGYRNVYWYRGGLRAWQMAGLRINITTN